MSAREQFRGEFREFGGLLEAILQEVVHLAPQLPEDGKFSPYQMRLNAVAVELAAIHGGLRATLALTQQIGH